MKRLRIICIITAVALMCTTVYASNVKFVTSEGSLSDIISVIKEKIFGTKGTQVMTDEDTFTAKDGQLNVKSSSYTEGKLYYSYPEEIKVTFSISKEPKKGTVEITNPETGEFVYTPDENKQGEDKFTFTAESEGIGKDEGTITVTIDGTVTPAPTSTSAPKYSFKYEDMHNHWGAYSASKLAENGIMRGECIGGKYYFYPDDEITRGEFIICLMSVLDMDVSEYTEIGSVFADAAAIPSWVSLQAKAAYDAGIIDGAGDYGEIYFRPDDILTRIEALTILNNTIRPNTKSVNKATYSDMYLVPTWGQEAVKNMTDYGIISGYEDNTIRPYVKVTRASAAEFLWQLYKYEKENPQMIKALEAEMDKNMYY